MSYLTQAIHRSGNMCPGDRNRKNSARKYSIPVLIQLTGAGFNFMSYIHPRWATARLSRLWFTVIQPRPGAWTKAFWASADQQLALRLPDQTIPLYLWGEGPLVVCLHGWAGSGTQFSYMIHSLVDAGYQVACLDAPSHGQNPGRTSHLLNFSACLSAINEQHGRIHTVIAHSFGAMATLMAAYRGVQPQQMVFIAPGLDVNAMYNTFCERLKLNRKLRNAVYKSAGNKMSAIAGVDDPWTFFQPDNMLTYSSRRSLIIYDSDDDEIAFEQVAKICADHPDIENHVTEKLGHNRILKNAAVISRITQWLSACGAMKNE